MARLLLLFIPAALLAGGLAFAQTAGNEAAALALAKREAAEAMERSRLLERQAENATGEAARARARAEGLAARIQAAEADITAAETRIRIVETLRAAQRARLARRQGPVVRLTAALQVMARRPPALALVQPGSLDDVVHVRALLASTLPVVRARTAGLRSEIDAGNRLRRDARAAAASLVAGQEELRKQRSSLASLEATQRRRSRSLAETALLESDRALALGEEARDLGALIGTRAWQAKVRTSLAALPGPTLRPPLPGERPPGPSRPPLYSLPVAGRLLVGTGEISDAGVHARGLTFETRAYAPVAAPAGGRIAYAGPFRNYRNIVVIDHRGGYTSLITHLGRVDVKAGEMVPRGARLGRAAGGSPEVTVELRREGQPVAITPLIAGS
jgi:septal ring factor EnvC (AmiA/AmiB activator)